jgi:hypothetical protein
MTSLRALCLLTCLSLLPGCLFSSITVPLDTDVMNTTLGAKTGEAYYHSILGLVAWGDAGTQAAAREGGIGTIRHMDQHHFMVLFGVYYKQTTIVYGD